MRAAIVLAAGQSRRFGRADKLMAPLRGEPLLLHAVRAAHMAPAGRTIVVSGEAGRVRGLLRHARLNGVTVVRPGYRGGPLSASLEAAIAALRPIERDAFVFLGDMPFVDPAMPGLLVRRIGQARIARPRHRGVPGHPVLVRGIRDARLGGGDAGFGGDRGAVAWVRSGPACTADVDRRGDLLRARRRVERR